MCTSSKKHRELQVRLLEEYVFTGTLRKEDKERADYKYVHFSVPKQADIIHVSCDYANTASNKNTVDIGVFGREGSFRGWIDRLMIGFRSSVD